jgi:hypothetical protein
MRTIDENERLYERVSHSEYQEIGRTDFDPETLERIERAVASNGGRPVNSRDYFPRNFFKNP